MVWEVGGGSSNGMEGRDVLFVNGDSLGGIVLVVRVEEGDRTK